MKQKTHTEEIATIKKEMTSLQRQISLMRKVLQDNGMVITTTAGKCILGQDQANCPHASPYRYQKGCRGDSCRTANSTYYAPRRVQERAARAAGVPVKVRPVKKAAAAPVPVPKKKVLRRAPAK